MSFSKQLPSEMAEWIVRSLDGTITAEQFAQLDNLITTNSAARSYYLEFITTYVGLVDLVGVLPKPADIVLDNRLFNDEELSELLNKSSFGTGDAGPLRFEPDMSEEDKKRQIEMYAHQQLEAFLEQENEYILQHLPRRAGWDIFGALDRAAERLAVLVRTGIKVAKAAVIFSLVVAVITIIALYTYMNRTVAILIDSTDAKWDVPIEEQTMLKPQYMRLEEGYAHILLKKGTEVILQAPSTFKLQTSNKMLLENGWITAKVPLKATGFTVNTPISSVVDFGTEFGLLVGAESSAEVHVFDGKVGLESSRNIGAVKHYQSLEKGEAVTIDITGRVDRSTVKDRPRLFVRTMPTSSGFGIPGKRLNLADIVGGGNGLNTGIPGRGIDPSTGKITLIREALRLLSPLQVSSSMNARRQTVNATRVLSTARCLRRPLPQSI